MKTFDQNILNRKSVMNLNKNWPKSFNASEDTKCISTCVDQNPSHANEDSKCISTCVEQWYRWQKMHLNMCWPKRQRGHIMHLNSFWPKTLLCQRGHKIYLNMYWRKPIPCHRGLTMFLNMWWSNITYANEDTKSLTYQRGKNIISACVVNARTQNVSQNELTKHNPDSEDTNCFLRCVDQTHTKLARTQNLSHHWFNNPLSWQIGFKM